MKKSVTAAITISLLAIATVAAYGAYTINSGILVKPNQEIQISNYSAAIDTLKPQISSLSNNITSLGTVKSDISDIKGKLSDLETEISKAQQEAIASQKPVMILYRSTYFQGYTIHITAAGLDSQTTATMQVLDNTGFVVMHRDTSSDSSGRISFDFPLSLTLAPGDYTIRVIAGQSTVSQPISIISSGITYSSLYQFTAHTDKGVYLSGDIIGVSGVGAPNTSVTGIITSPSGRTLMSHTTVQPDGTYNLLYADSSPYETGSWYITLTNQGFQRVVYFTVTANPPVILYSFTAQAGSNIYLVGNLIGVTGTAQPSTVVDAVLTSPSGLTYTDRTTASSSGSYAVTFSTAQGYETGNWFITLTNQGQSRQVSIFLESSSSSNGSDTFTAQTDKTIYVKGDQIQISGIGKPYTAVHAIMTSPSGKTYDTAVSTGLDGSYTLSYYTSSAYETGNWYITLTNQFMAKVISIFLEPTG